MSHVAVGAVLQSKWPSTIRVCCTPMLPVKRKIMGVKEQIWVSICLSVCVPGGGVRV